MAPPLPIVDLYTSSLELDARSTHPLHLLLARADEATTAPKHGLGATPPEKINNAGFFALFAILGVALVGVSLWFFFWAKNGGFHFQEGDWDDYKSTVLRRKGPDGKTLSNATKSTKLGGGTIAGSQHYAWQKQAARSVVGRDEKGRKGILAKRGWAGTHSVLYSDDYMTESFATQTVSDEMTELRPDNVDLEQGHGHSKRYRDRDVHQYKKEKPARVGGLNRVADADSSHYDYTNSNRSDIMSETVISTSSDQPILPKKDNRQREQERAERKAREEAARMERRWRREAEAAAAALAQESTATRKKSAAPTKPSPSKQRERREASRSTSPKKRDFSYTNGPESETLSTAYTQSTAPSQRTASYYDSYRPKAESSRPRQSSPRKKQGAPTTRSGGYRRGGTDSDLE